MDGEKADKPVDTGLHSQVNGETRKPANERTEPLLAWIPTRLISRVS